VADFVRAFLFEVAASRPMPLRTINLNSYNLCMQNASSAVLCEHCGMHLHF